MTVITPQKYAQATGGIVSAPHFLAAEAGGEVLRRGGNAIEAAIAVGSTLAVVYPHMNGLGGDAFWLISDGNSESAMGLAAAGPAGHKYSAHTFCDAHIQEIPFRGGRSALTVPGIVAGWGTAYDYSRNSWHGSLSWGDLLETAYEHALRGFPISPNQTATLTHYVPVLYKQPGFSHAFMPNGEIPKPDAVWPQKALGRTIKEIAENGPESFYQGYLAEKMIKGLRASGSLLTEKDMSSFRTEWMQPLRVPFGHGEVLNLPAPTQGLASLMILALLDRFKTSFEDHWGADFIHCSVEITKQVFGWRDQVIADPHYHDFDLSALLKASFLDDIAALIEPRHIQPSPALDTGAGDTVWFGVADATGRMVSVIQSLYHEFGCGVVAGDTGVLWNNRGCAFSLTPGHINILEPGKRPFHTLNPAMYAENKRVQLAYGTMGGDGQPQTQAAILMRAKHFGLSLAEAVASPRWLYGRTWGERNAGLRLEHRYPKQVYNDLQSWGHMVAWVPDYSDVMGHAGMVGFANAEKSTFAAATDPRSDGGVMGVDI
ncbi:gamma-glutamyltransferase [Acidithiobacillus montserratensis]|uniref:Gamma-glutamyltransferase n=1 Tax=Acidithiobacillus montserratensis TaxID=2729135 RepID=A0ACD5HER5_9PROT|nr:gamma-glutamyltransferase [Acidithiobacillus montserratensis]MBU2747971.1 gamma-glutamyltransferase [Acidithiobacillus montserratensis]